MTSLFSCADLSNTMLVTFYTYIVILICYPTWVLQKTTASVSCKKWGARRDHFLWTDVWWAQGSTPRYVRKLISPRQASGFIQTDKKSLMTASNRKINK